MEKLLHERLRSWGSDITVLGPLVIGGREHYTIPPKTANDLADEIERTYHPIPRDPDGNPVSFGTMAVTRANGETEPITRICFTPSGYYFNSSKGAKRYAHGEPFQRHAPKVYDADGVEIKKGDKVWHLVTGTEFIVESLPTDGRMNLLLRGKVGGIGEITTSWYAPDEVTHERPVFDAEGERIKVGDVVWHKQTGEKHMVEELTGDGGVYIDRSSLTWGGDILTHKEPDSLEKLRDDMRAFGEVGADCTSDCCLSYVDRLTALIERGA